MKKHLLSIFFLFSVITLHAQELEVKAETGNISNTINDGSIALEVYPVENTLYL